MGKKLVSLIVCAALTMGLTPTAAFAAGRGGSLGQRTESIEAAAAVSGARGELQAAQLEAPLDKAAIDSGCILLRADGNLWQCTSAGAPVSLYWDGDAYGFGGGLDGVRKIYVASDVRSIGSYAKINVDYGYGVQSSFNKYFSWSFPHATTLHFLADSRNANACSSIADGAFQSWEELTQVVGFERTRLTRIGKQVFTGTGVRSLALPPTLKAIASYAFYDTEDLHSISGLNKTKVSSIGKYAFKGCGVRSLSLPKTLKTISSYGFYGAEDLRTIGGLNKTKLTSLAAYAFQDCESLRSVSLPRSCKVVGDRAFEGCKQLKAVALGSKTARIEGWAFSNCERLASIKLPASCKRIGSSAFSGCIRLKKVVLQAKSMVRNGTRASYSMYSVFYQTPLMRKGGSAKILVPKSQLAKYRSPGFDSPWRDFRTKIRPIG